MIRADPDIEEPHNAVVDAACAAGLPEHLPPPPGREHPLVQPFAGMAEGLLEALTFAGPEAVERNRDVLDADEGHHRCPPLSRPIPNTDPPRLPGTAQATTP